MTEQIKVLTGFDYWAWPDFFNKKEIKEFNKLLKKHATIKEPESEAATHGNKKVKYLRTLHTYFEPISKFTDRIIPAVHYTNQRHFGYNLYQGFEHGSLGNYNIYSSKTKDNYDWHVDASKSPIFDTKFTLLVNLSEDTYEGGDLRFFNQTEYTATEFQPGCMLMFKSHLNHKVTPVTKGERKTFTIFFTGPTWK